MVNQRAYTSLFLASLKHYAFARKQSHYCFKGSVVQQRVRQDSVIFSRAGLRRARLKMQAFVFLCVCVGTIVGHAPNSS